MFYSIKFNITFDSITGQPLGPKEINVKHILHITIIKSKEKKEKKILKTSDLRLKLTDGQIFDTQITVQETIAFVETSFVYFKETYDSVYEHGLSTKYVNHDHIVQVTPIVKSNSRVTKPKYRIKLTDNNSIDVIDLTSLDKFRSNIK